ncbi:ISAs1 family transposase [Dapis sp. BLCC M229]|uniref:ISAs1 family transposase n=1 Tax=Dapis sp. BLCC M229 TaxID=3400188 RepID=UPI003CF5F628
MKLQLKKSIYEYFSKLEDPRVDRTKRHKLIDIIIITICAVICSADTWVDIEAYGESKYEWLKSFLELPNGIPSHDTFARVFARARPRTITAMFFVMDSVGKSNN